MSQSDEIMDSSDDEKDDFLREMISNIIISQSKNDLNEFEVVKLQYQYFK